MFVLTQSTSIPANDAGIVVGALSVLLTVAWLVYFYR